ncbi:DNA primase [Cutibacterium acnes JCM 18916]|nr:DNA primase [Cutibacterium acnes JCM 18916]GAE76020.1 DNA primase [Cutibacterium acnes JCM 18918]
MAKGFAPKVLIESGLVRSQGWDFFFQGRVLWPIKDSGKSVLGFGARRVYDDDRLPAKYVNTPETPVYKKNHMSCTDWTWPGPTSARRARPSSSRGTPTSWRRTCPA